MLSPYKFPQFPWYILGMGFIAVVLGAGIGVGISILETPLYAIAGLIAVIGALTCLLNPKIGLYILVAITYLRLSDVLVNYYGAPSIAKPFVALMIGVVLFRWWYHESPPKGTVKVGLLVLAYGLVISLSIFHASNFTAVQEALDDFWKNAVIAIIVVVLLTDKKALRIVIWVVIATGIFMGTISVWQYTTGTFSNTYWGFGIASIQNISGSSSGYRIAGPIGDPNFYSQIMLFIVPLAFIRFMQEKNIILKGLGLYGTIISVLTIVFTFSRGAFLALLLVTVILLYLHPPKPRDLLLSMAVFILIFPYIPAGYFDRILTLNELVTENNSGTSEVSFRGRTSEYLAAWMMFSDNPILGVGVQNYNTYYQKYSRQIGLDPRTEARSAHSLYLEVAAELGLAGLAVLSAIIIAVYRSVSRSWKLLKKLEDDDLAQMILSIGLGIAGYLFAAIFIHDAYPRYFWLIIGMGLALSEVARREIETKQNTSSKQILEGR